MTTIHQIRHEQVIDTNLESAWDFIRKPENLDRITPSDMEFEIISDVPEQMYDGLLIEYRIGIPLLGKQTWLTEIKHVRQQHSFVDEQRVGPYRLWYHYHEISEQDEGIRFIDHVHYMLPFGPLGGIAHAIYVKSKLKHIFQFREQALQQAFK